MRVWGVWGTVGVRVSVWWVGGRVRRGVQVGSSDRDDRVGNHSTSHISTRSAPLVTYPAPEFPPEPMHMGWPLYL